MILFLKKFIYFIQLYILFKLFQIVTFYNNCTLKFLFCQKNKMFINIKYDFDKYNKIAKQKERNRLLYKRTFNVKLFHDRIIDIL